MLISHYFMHALSFYKRYLKQPEYLWSAFTALAFLALSLVVNWYAGLYAAESASNSVTDIILTNTRTYDVDTLFIYGTFAFWAFILYLCIRHPQNLPFTVRSIAFFVVIRSVFISLTHIGPFPTQMIVNSHVLAKFSFGADLFFSGHTGLPVLMALIYWKKIYLRILFILSAFFFATIVLLAHLHYSIDVLSAFFITYTIFHLAEMFFKKDRFLFEHGLES